MHMSGTFRPCACAFRPHIDAAARRYNKADRGTVRPGVILIHSARAASRQRYFPVSSHISPKCSPRAVSCHRPPPLYMSSHRRLKPSAWPPQAKPSVPWACCPWAESRHEVMTKAIAYAPCSASAVVAPPALVRSDAPFGPPAHPQASSPPCAPCRHLQPPRQPPSWPLTGATLWLKPCHCRQPPRVSLLLHRWPKWVAHWSSLL
jgi:hypothetical protein